MCNSVLEIQLAGTVMAISGIFFSAIHFMEKWRRKYKYAAAAAANVLHDDCVIQWSLYRDKNREDIV